MIDQSEHKVLAVSDVWMNESFHEPLLITHETFTRSNGTMLSRIYERLTKASRRRNKRDGGARWMITWSMGESMYRMGVYDAYKALQEELEQ